MGDNNYIYCSDGGQQLYMYCIYCSDGGKTLFHAQMGENKLYLMFRGRNIAIFNVQMGTTTLFIVQMGDNKLNLLFRWGITSNNVPMGNNNSTVFTAQIGDKNSI
jgi:hypothetical protein